MSLYRSKKKYKIRLLFLISLIIFSIFIFFPKKNWKENLVQNLRIYTCQPNFTTVYDNQYFKIKRLFYGFFNSIKNGCKYDSLKINVSFKNFNTIKKDRQIALAMVFLQTHRKFLLQLFIKIKSIDLTSD